MSQAAAQPLKYPVSSQLHNEPTLGERLADTVAHQIGSWRFLIIQSTAMSLWVALNVVAVLKSWDPYPFVLLNLLFSVQAAYTGPVLLLSSNRAAQRDRVMAEHDFETNARAEQFIQGLMSELLRNSQATLAIAKHLDIQVEGLDQHGADLEAKVQDVQDQLVEVEDVLAAEAQKDAAAEGDL